MNSEPALDRGYGALLMRCDPTCASNALLDHLLEFKTVSLKAVGLSGAELAAIPRETLRTLPAVADKLAEAEQQLLSYQ